MEMEIKYPNYVDNTTRKKTGFIKIEIFNSLQFVMQYDYFLTGIKVKEDSFFKYYFEFILLNAKENRKVSIDYYPFSASGDTEDSLSIRIVREPYENHYDFFSLGMYLDRETDIQDNDLKIDTNKAFPDEIKRVLGIYNHSLETDYFKSILLGESWDDKFYPRW